MPTADRSTKAGIWSRIKSKLKPYNKPPEPESTTLPVMDTFEPDTCRMMEIRYASKDEN